MTAIHRDWQVAHAALTHAADVVTREAEHASGAGRHGVAAELLARVVGFRSPVQP